MALMMSSRYDALRSAGAGDESARKAAEEVAAYDARFAKTEADLTLLKWMVGLNLAFSAAITAKLFS